MVSRERPLKRNLEDAAAAKATPGGRSVAAKAGALASTMASMAAGFTAGREKFKHVQTEIEAALARLADLRDRLLYLADKDMDAYEKIMAAYRLPKETNEQKKARSAAVRDATENSLAVVEAVLDACREILVVTRRLADIANPNLISDVGVAAELALGAAHAARINAEVNLRGLGDEADAAAVRERVEEALADSECLAEETRTAVLNVLRR